MQKKSLKSRDQLNSQSFVVTYKDVKVEIRNYPIGISILFGFGTGLGVGITTIYYFFFFKKT